MIRTILFSISLFTFLSSQTEAQDYFWKYAIQSGWNCTSVDIDRNNDLYITGFINNNYDDAYFGETEIQTPKKEDYSVYIIKTDTLFNIQWTKVIENSYFSEYPIIKVDKDNNFILCFDFYNNIQIDSITINGKEVNNYTYHSFVLTKFDSSGNLVWYNIIRTNSWYLFLNDLKIDENNDIYVVGNCSNQLILENEYNIDTTIYQTEGEGNFIIKYGSNGTLYKAQSIENNHQLSLESIDVDSVNNVYVTGWWYLDAYFGGKKYESKNADIFIAKYNPQLQFEWVRTITDVENSSSDYANYIALDSKANIYITGSIRGQMDFFGKEVNPGDQNIFLAKYNSDGYFRWVTTAGGWSGAASSVEYGKKIIIDENDYVYLMGNFGPKGIFDNIELTAYDNKENSNLYYDVFIAKYYSNGELSWVTHAGEQDDEDFCTGFALDNNSNIFLTGKTTSGAIFGDSILTSSYWPTGFIARLKGDYKKNRMDNSDVIIVSTNFKKENIELKIFPNPTEGEIGVYIQNNFDKIIGINLYNIDGKIIYDKNTTFLSNNTYYYNLRHLKSGIYFLRVNTLSNSYVSKIIKKVE